MLKTVGIKTTQFKLFRPYSYHILSFFASNNTVEAIEFVTWCRYISSVYIYGSIENCRKKMNQSHLLSRLKQITAMSRWKQLLLPVT